MSEPRLDEIISLVADLRTFAEMDAAYRRDLREDEIQAHQRAILRMRELMQELSSRRFGGFTPAPGGRNDNERPW